MEILFTEGEKQSHNKAETERKDNLQQRLQNDRKNVNGSCADGFSNTEGNGENNKTDCII